MISEETRAYYDLKKRNDVRESVKGFADSSCDIKMPKSSIVCNTKKY